MAYHQGDTLVAIQTTYQVQQAHSATRLAQADSGHANQRCLVGRFCYPFLRGYQPAEFCISLSLHEALFRFVAAIES